MTSDLLEVMLWLGLELGLGLGSGPGSGYGYGLGDGLGDGLGAESGSGLGLGSGAAHRRRGSNRCQSLPLSTGAAAGLRCKAAARSATRGRPYAS